MVIQKNKHDEENRSSENRVRLVMRGYRQEEGIDFEESFALFLARMEAFGGLFLAYAAHKSFIVSFDADIKPCLQVKVRHYMGFMQKSTKGMPEPEGSTQELPLDRSRSPSIQQLARIDRFLIPVIVDIEKGQSAPATISKISYVHYIRVIHSLVFTVKMESFMSDIKQALGRWTCENLYESKLVSTGKKRWSYNNTLLISTVEQEILQECGEFSFLQAGRWSVRLNSGRKGKNKLAYAPKPKIPPPPKREDPTKDSICHQCGETGHWKRNCPQYLAELLKNKKLSQGASVTPHKFQVMAALVISISSDLSVESVGSSFPRVILIGSISVEVPVAPEVGAAAVASPAGVLELDTHSSSEADPSESSLPPVSVAPMVSPFLCSDDSESDTEMPERHVSPTPHDAMLTRWRSRVASRSSSPTTSTPEIPTAPIPPAPSAVVAPSTDIISPVDAPPGIRRRRAILIRPGEDIPIGRLYRTHPGGPCRALTARKSVRPLPSHRLALRYTSHHLDHFTSGSSSGHSSSDHSSSGHSISDHSSSDHSSSGHSISGHSLSGHTPPDTTIADSSAPSRFCLSTTF
ncbi:putative reverse transcriptase domain-containing protein [Tanacetum coccineum]